MLAIMIENIPESERDSTYIVEGRGPKDSITIGELRERVASHRQEQREAAQRAKRGCTESKDGEREKRQKV